PTPAGGPPTQGRPRPPRAAANGPAPRSRPRRAAKRPDGRTWARVYCRTRPNPRATKPGLTGDGYAHTLTPPLAGERACGCVGRRRRRSGFAGRTRERHPRFGSKRGLKARVVALEGGDLAA